MPAAKKAKKAAKEVKQPKDDAAKGDAKAEAEIADQIKSVKA